MKQNSNERKVTLAGEIYLEMTVGEDCDGGTEIRNIVGIDALIGRAKNLSPVNFTLAELAAMAGTVSFLHHRKRDALEALIDRQDKEEKEQAEQDRIYDE